MYQLAIVWNHPDILERAVNLFTRNKRECETDLYMYLCSAFERQECKEVLLKHGFHKTASRTDNWSLSKGERVKTLLDFLFRWYDDYDLADAIIPVLKQLGDLTDLFKWLTAPEVVEHPKHYLHWYNEKLSRTKPMNITILKMLLDCGSDVNCVNTDGLTPLQHQLQNARKQIIQEYSSDVHSSAEAGLYLSLVRQVVEMYIMENSDIDMNKDAVFLAIRLDEKIHKEADFLSKHYNLGFYSFCCDGKLPSSLIADGRIHGVYDHDDENFAFNFYAPLFIESGFQILGKIGVLQDKLKNLHPVEKAYIENTIDKPRSLKMTCRDSLRKHFKGKKIHWFVEKSKLPTSVKDYILLKPLLNLVQRI